MKPTDLLFDLSLSIWCLPATRVGPGQIVMGLPDEKREILKQLKSDDLKNIRPDVIWGRMN